MIGVTSVSAIEWASRMAKLSWPGVSIRMKSWLCSTCRKMSWKRRADRFIVVDAVAGRLFQLEMVRHKHGEALAPVPSDAVLDVAAEAELARVEIDRRDLVPAHQERNGKVHGGRRLARAAFFIAANDDVSLLRLYSTAAKHAHTHHPYARYVFILMQKRNRRNIPAAATDTLL